MTVDRLADLAERLERLGERPLPEHLETLDDVHRTLVGELDALGGATYQGDAHH